MMKESIEERMGKYLAGEATEVERIELEKEMVENPTMREHFAVLERIWLLGRKEDALSWDTDQAWQKFAVRTHRQAPQKSVNRTRRLSWAVAATLVLALGAAVFLRSGQKPVSYTYSPDLANPIQLADGSKVFLNEGSSLLVYPFNRKLRRVGLSGEAYFEISPNANKPFIVEAGNSVTEVVGTEFNIEETKDRTTIFVKNGKVIFRSVKNAENALALTSGEAAVMEQNELQRIVNPSPNIHAWRTRELSFNNMPLAAVIADVSSYFDKEISIENELVKNCRISIPKAFQEPEINSILTAVALSINANLLIEGDKCIIQGGNCF